MKTWIKNGPPRVGVLLVAYNNEPHVRACLESILSGTYGNIQVILIDNGSEGHYGDLRRMEVPVHYNRMADNVGFCAASNVGIAKSVEIGTDYTLMLNPDTVLAPDAIERLVGAAEGLENPGIIGGKIFYSGQPDKLWYAGGHLSWLAGVGRHHAEESKSSDRNVDYVTGCCMLVPTRLFLQIGGLKEELFMYLDDAEFCLRVRKAGYAIHYEPSAVLYHAVGAGAQRALYSDYYLYFSIRNKPYISENPLYRLYLRLFTLALAISKLGFYGLAPGVPDRRASLKAVLWGYLDSFSLSVRYQRRFPRLFRRRAPVGF